MTTTQTSHEIVNGKITSRTLVPVGVIAAAGVVIVAVVLRFSTVSAATEINDIRINTTSDRIDRIENRLDRIDMKLDEILKEIRR